MQDQLNLTLPSKSNQQIETHSKVMLLLISVVLIAVLINIGLIFVPIQKKMSHRSRSTELPPEARKQMALKLEKQGLNAVAAEVWTGYLSTLDLDPTQTAKIWYRIGTLHQKANNYVKALTSYYRSESFAKLDHLSSDINRRIQECLEALGRYSALRYELSDRVGIPNPKQTQTRKDKGGDKVVAEIGPEKITQADLDNRIENQIEQQLFRLSSYLSTEQRQKQKEQLLKQFSNPQQRRIFLHSYVLEEILYRKAEDDKLIEQPEIQTLLKEQKRRLLAQKVIDNAFKEHIDLTEADLKTYYEAHKEDFVSPEQAQIAHILVKDAQAAQEVRNKLAQGHAFNELAADDTTGDSANGASLGWIENRPNTQIPSIGTNPEGIKAIFKTPAGHIVPENIPSPAGIHIIRVNERKAAQQKSFDEVKDEIFRTLRQQKEEEIKQQLFAQLKDKYDVVVHSAKFVAPPSEAPPKPPQGPPSSQVKGHQGHGKGQSQVQNQ